MSSQTQNPLPSESSSRFIWRSLHHLPRWLIGGLVFPLIILNVALLIGVLQYFRSIIGILVTAALLSFILDYPVRLLQRGRVQRQYAVFWVFIVTILFITLLGLTLGPLVVGQLTELVQRLPTWIATAREQLQNLNIPTFLQRFPINWSAISDQMVTRFASQLQFFTERLLTLALDTVGSVLDFVLTIVLTFYLLLHGDRLWHGVFQWLPDTPSQRIKQSLRQSFHNYYVGQAAIAGLMGSAMIICFLVLGVPFGLLFGLGVGVMALVPFGAPFTIFLVCLIISLNDVGVGFRTWIIAMLINQLIENAIAPRLLGDFTGLNPVWILVSLLVGAKIAGLLGLLIAVPTASLIKQMINHSQPSSALSPTVPQ